MTFKKVITEHKLPGRRHSTGRMRWPSSDVPFSLQTAIRSTAKFGRTTCHTRHHFTLSRTARNRYQSYACTQRQPLSGVRRRHLANRIKTRNFFGFASIGHSPCSCATSTLNLTLYLLGSTFAKFDYPSPFLCTVRKDYKQTNMQTDRQTDRQTDSTCSLILVRVVKKLPVCSVVVDHPLIPPRGKSERFQWSVKVSYPNSDFSYKFGSCA